MVKMSTCKLSPDPKIGINCAKSRVAGRSHLAMVLSMVIPGSGQIYLRKPLDGLILLFGVVFAGILIYINSYPVTSWRDVTRLESSPDLIRVGKIGDTKLMFRRMWQFKVSGLIQGLVFWIYAIYDGWLGQTGFSKRAFQKVKGCPKTTHSRRNL